MSSEKFSRYASSKFTIDESTSSQDEDKTIHIKRSHKGKTGHRKNYLKIPKPIIYLLVSTIFFLFLLIGIDIKLKLDSKKEATRIQENHQTKDTNTTKKASPCKTKTYCDDVLKSATSGRWLKHPSDLYTPWKTFSLEDTRTKLGLPKNMTRNDFRCGIHFPIPQTRLAALCDAKTEAYCCCESTGFCGKTKLHCQHDTSFNMLDIIPEKRAVWLPQNSKCNLKEFTKSETCEIMTKAVKKIVFLGDSQARQLFASFILQLTGQYTNGAIKEQYRSNKFVKENCSSSYQVINNDCRKYLITNTREIKNLCGKASTSFEIKYFPNFESFVSKKTSAMYESLYDKKDTYIIVGAGTHFNSDHHSFLQYFFEYMVKQKKKRKWPHYILETLHNVYSPTSTSKRREFNKMVIKKAQELNVDVLDNSQLTKRMESYDGRNFGLKFQMLKVKMLLHYFHNLINC